MRNYLTLAGVDSRDYGVYISGQGTFSAPERAYEFYGIPGRNGALIGNEKRLENIEVSYEAFIYDNFSENVANFRSFLLSLVGYQRLEDSYHPDEFRLACYVGPFEPEVEAMNNAGKFTITFNCKPQRYLKDGETTYTYGTDAVISGATISVNGSILNPTYLKVYFDSDRTKIGNPTNPIHYLQPTSVGVAIDGSTVVQKSFTVSNSRKPSRGSVDLYNGTGIASYVVTPLPTSGWTATTTTVGGRSITYFTHASSFLPANNTTFASHFYNTTGLTKQNMINKGGANNVIGIPTDDTTKLLVCSPNFPSGTTAAQFQSWISQRSSGTGFVWVESYLSTPATITLESFTPTYPANQIQIQGAIYPQSTSKVFTAYSTVSVKYAPTDDMDNPTVFPSKPLIRVYGTGAFKVNDITITVTTASTYTDIDCDLMDCYEEGTNRNNDVSFSTYDFPELQPGSNSVTISTSSISLVEITPRWWRL